MNSKKKFLVIVQDLRISGTSEGIVSRSFLAKLRKIYPDALIHVEYIIHTNTDDQLHLLPVDNIKKSIVNPKIPFNIVFINRFYWRLFHVSLNDRYIQKQYAKIISKIDYKDYDNIFIRSAGINHETILGTCNLPILKKANLIFHDPYPLSWYAGSKTVFSNLELFRLKRMMTVVKQSKTCSSSANYMSNDLQSLYGAKKRFHILAHQFEPSVFDLSDVAQVRKKSKKITISYHGALMFGRNVENLLLAYQRLINENAVYEEDTEFVLRLKGDGIKKLKEQFGNIPNIEILETINFSNSSNEQIHESDIVIILENGPFYCNILVGKASFLASSGKPVLCVSPEKSELRKIIIDSRCIANMHSIEELKEKLKNLIDNRMTTKEIFKPFGDYFSDIIFQTQLNEILNDD